MKIKYPVLLALFCASTAQATSVFINEIHYDNADGDVGEFIEIAAPQGTDLTDWSVALYNGSSSQRNVYATETLAGVVQDRSGGYGFMTVYPSSIQNGGPDGMALIDADGNVVQFLSYEGSFEAASGPAVGLTSIDIGVAESGSTPVGYSLQLSGSGSEYTDFSWQAENTETPDDVNHGQSFGGEVTDSPPSVVISPADGDSNVAVDAHISLTFNEAVVISAYNTINCANQGAITLTASGEGVSYLLDPDQDFAPGDNCSFTVSATDVTDLDGEPNNMAEDVTVSFNVIDSSVTVSLVINEFLADPAGDISGDANSDGERDSSADEFVELVNAGDADVDLSDWTLSDGFGVRHTFPSGSVIEAGCAAVVFGGGAPQGVFGGALVQTASTGAVGFNNGGDTITLANGVSRFEVVYGSEGGNNQSLTLNPDVTGESYSAHSAVTAANGALFSPGTQLDGTPFSGCSVPDIAPTVVNVTPADGATEVSVDSVINLTFSEAVTVSQWPSLACEVTGDVGLNGALSGTEFTLTPATQLSGSESCTFTLPAASVADVDGTPDMLANDFVSTFSTAELLVCASPESYTYISAVQGNGSASGFVDQTVTVQGAVTAVFLDLNAFFIQEEADDNDGDPTTSEGVYVYNAGGAFNLPVIGDVVAVKGRVSEFFNRTQITLTSAPLVCGNATILATEFTLPVTSLDDFESLEGMLVSASQELIVSDNFRLGRYGEVALSNGRLFNPTNVFLPGSSEAQALQNENSLNVVFMGDANDVQNPDPVIYPTGNLSAFNTLRGGDTVSSVTGVLDFDFGKFLINPTVAPTFAATNPRTAAPEVAPGNLKVASLNVLNFFNGDGQGGGFPTPRGADSVVEYERQIAKTVTAIVAIDADILGLMEIENDGFDNLSAIAQLTAAVNAAIGENAYSFVSAGSPIGTDEITVGLLYKNNVVDLSGAVDILDSSNSISDEQGPLFNTLRNRPALSQKFALLENGEEIVISVNHFKSKGSGCGAGDDDTTTGQGNCNVTRTRAAQALVSHLEQNFEGVHSLIIGDLNSYAKEDPITTIVDAGFTNLIEHFQGAEAYSYTFDGKVGYLDHALASASLVEQAVDASEWHINADEPIVLDYNLEFKSQAQQTNLYAPDQYRMSDHDPVIMTFQLAAATVIGDFDGDLDIDRLDLRAFIQAIVRRKPLDISLDFNLDGKVTIRDVLLLSRQCTRRGCRTN